MQQRLNGLYHDRLFGAALIAAPLFWLTLIFVGQQPVDWLLPAVQTLVLVALVYPLLEEIVFRGALQGWLYARPPLRKDVYGFSGANLVTSLVFALLHLFTHTPLHALLIFFPSLLFGFFRDRYHSIVPGLLLHVGYNLGSIWLFAG